MPIRMYCECGKEEVMFLTIKEILNRTKITMFCPICQKTTVRKYEKEEEK